MEKTDHPCQFPVAIPQRLIRALTKENQVVFDPFMGAGTTGVAATTEVGVLSDPKYKTIIMLLRLKE